MENETTTREIFVRDDWELTWPIWHMLPRRERKDIAKQHGYASIGDFEEFMSLQKAVGDSSSVVYENQSLYRTPNNEDTSQHRHLITTIEEHTNEQDSQGEAEETAAEIAEHQLNEELENSGRRQVDDEILASGGQILKLPDEMLHRAFAFLPVDAYATMALVSPHWKSFTRTEAVYKKLCERLYLNQSKRRVLFVSRFDNSYRTMLERRPRVKAGGGRCTF